MIPTAGDDDESEIGQYSAQPRSVSVRGFHENQKCSYPTTYRVAKDYLSMMAMSVPSESMFSRVKNIVTDNRNKSDTTTIRILAIPKARCLLRNDRSIADSFQGEQVNMDANQDFSVADDATSAGDASSAQSSAASSEKKRVLVSSDDE